MDNDLNIGEPEELMTMQAAPDRNQASWLDRTEMYGLLRLVFLTGPGPELIAALPVLQMKSTEARTAEFNAHLEALQKTIESESNQSITRWQTEFTRLFIGPGKAPAYPYECVYRSPNRLLMQEITGEVRQFYLEQGLIMERLNTIPDDHLGVELEFLLYLSQKMLERPEEALTYAGTQREFLRKHILSWIDDFVNDILNNTNEPFFQHLALLLRDFVHWDERFLGEFKVVS